MAAIRNDCKLKGGEVFVETQYQLLAKAIANKSATVGVVGLGYVGLPLVRAFIEAGLTMMGFDIDPVKIAKLVGGQSYIKHLPGEWIAECVLQRRFVPTAEMQRLNEPDVILICVPTPLAGDRDPDLSFVESTGRQVAAVLRPGQLIVLESTTYPGTTREVLLPILAESGLVVGRHYFLAYSPEREDPGNPNHSAKQIPKLVGGIDPASRELALALYSHAVVETVPVASCEVAEAAKILENTYRAVNVAMVNELKILFDRMGIDVWEVIDAAKTKPFGFQAFYPGPGLGGHCIPVDPFYLSWLARQNDLSTRFIELAGEVNTSMPGYVIERLTKALGQYGKQLSGSKVTLLGVAYKKDVDDPRESPSFKLIELLLAGGALVSYNDPHISRLPSKRVVDVPDLTSELLTADFLAAQDCILIATDHSSYDWDFIVQHSSLIIDTRNATKDVQQGCQQIFKA